MPSQKQGQHLFARRTFLKGMGWAPILLLPAPIGALPYGSRPSAATQDEISFPLCDFRLTPVYPAKSPLESVLRQVTPGGDGYLTEKYADEIMMLLEGWSQSLKTEPPNLRTLAQFLAIAIEFTPLNPTKEIPLRSDYGVHVWRRKFSSPLVFGRDRFLDEIKTYLSSIKKFDTAEFQIVGIQESGKSSPTLRVDIRYDLVGAGADSVREERIGHWLTVWAHDNMNGWRALRWEAAEETLSRARAPIFIDITSQALGQNDSYGSQMLRGVDHWRTVLDGACGIDVYGNNGVAVGDVDGDGFDDIYVSQPAGLPNRLYRNRGDGTFEDVTAKSGLGVLDATGCALFADFENKGLQDLLVVSNAGPLLFLNQGNAKFALKRDAFKFVNPPQGTFTHAAIADYDRDGRLDIYFCLYSYYLGLDQYHYPAPYFDARNGPPNFLFRNQGDGTFQDRTEDAGLNAENDRYSFACAWGDYNGDGAPDLYVVNDFGRSNLYRNNGDGTFTAASAEAGIDDPGAGMSACCSDLDADGKQDFYVANMWSAGGMRVSEQEGFHENEPASIRALYRQHARGNSLYRNQGNGHFRNLTELTGAAMGRWAWSSDAWDFDHDGYPDLYIANGYISGADSRDLGSFFWRQVVAKSPATFTPSPDYELGWNAINELIRADGSWSGNERNVFYLNNGDGTFSEVSGAVGLDFPQDSRAFALADFDHDGRLEVVLKNRNAPQLRILRNAMNDLGHSITFRLRGTKSNRDSIGAAVTVEAAGRRQTKYLQAGSGFLSQHSKEIFFGVGKADGTIRADIHWPSGSAQSFERLPINHRIEIEEGSANFAAKPFASSPRVFSSPGEPVPAHPLPTSVETWLIEPLRAPQFSLPDVAGNSWDLQALRGGFVVLNFWATSGSASSDGLRLFRQYQAQLASGGLRVAAVSVDAPVDFPRVRSFVSKEGLSFPVLLATEEVTGIYNTIYRYLFDRRRDLPIPSSFLIDEDGMIIKIYQGPAHPQRLLEDLRTVPRNSADRTGRALPFEGTLYQGAFQRNDFTYGIAFFQRGYLDQATESFKQVIAGKPEDSEAHYNLGTLYLRRNNFPEARRHLETTVKLRPNYPEAWNNLGMLAAQEGRTDEAIRSFRQSLQLRTDYAVALVNLGNLYRRQKSFAEAQELLSHALAIEPNNPEASYNLGMLYAQQDLIPNASQYLEKAVQLRPDYPEALNNLGVLLIREQNYAGAESKFRACIQAAPDFDQAYLNLARLYVVQNEKEKAREVLQELLRRQPQHKMAQQALEMLE